MYRGRIGIYVDDVFHVDGRGVVSTNRAFWLFAVWVGRRFDDAVLFGRTVQTDVGSDYELGQLDIVALPNYPTLKDPSALVRAVPSTARAFWHGLSRVDAVWVFGPHPFALVLVALALLRRRAVLLGVREDTVEYARVRLAGERWARLGMLATLVMDRVFRLLAAVLPTAVVGPAIATRYGRSRRTVREMVVSLVRSATVTGVHPPSDDGVFRVLTVGRVDKEKNPFLLVDAISELHRRGHRHVRLDWVGRGPLEQAVRERAAMTGVADAVCLRGYVPFGPRLVALYQDADVFVHVSCTEGVPQVLAEAMAYGTPVVATDIGGVRALVTDGVDGILVPPGDVGTLADSVERIIRDPELGLALAGRALDVARRHTLEEEGGRAAEWVASVLSARWAK